MFDMSKMFYYRVYKIFDMEMTVVAKYEFYNLDVEPVAFAVWVAFWDGVRALGSTAHDTRRVFRSDRDYRRPLRDRFSRYCDHDGKPCRR